MFFEPESNLVTMFMPLCAILLEFWDSPLLSIFKLTNSGMKLNFFFYQRTWPCHIVALQCKIPTVLLTTDDTVCYRSLSGGNWRECGDVSVCTQGDWERHSRRGVESIQGHSLAAKLSNRGVARDDSES